MEKSIRQELIDWTWHNCVPEHKACGMPKNNVFCADCMVAFVKAERLKHHLTNAMHSDGQGNVAEEIWTNEDESAEIERQIIEDVRR